MTHQSNLRHSITPEIWPKQLSTPEMHQILSTRNEKIRLLTAQDQAGRIFIGFDIYSGDQNKQHQVNPDFGYFDSVADAKLWFVDYCISRKNVFTEDCIMELVRMRRQLMQYSIF